MVSPATFLRNAFLAGLLDDGLEMLCENDASGNAIYIGKAVPGALSSDAKWQIKKCTYDANNSVTEVRWADLTPAFTKVWDDRATYDYVA